MSLRLYNTLTKTKEDFVPLDPARVRMYVCGPTVYDFAHIGNARPAIVFDVLYRLLKHLAAQGEWDGGKGQTKVTYVRNITDVDDKINARAAEIAAARGISVEMARDELTAETERQYIDDVRALGCLDPDETPRATKHIPQMIAMIETLIAAGHAYAADGHVLFDVASKPDYGKLARRSLDEMIAGARVDVASYKKGEMDFVLWKPSVDSKGDAATPGWESPWGRGRPGWHIECSAMAGQYLGETFDIHGGGIDLMFPHHENEIAQSEGAHHGHPLAKVWMHNGFLQVEGEKMSKSLGNFFTIRDLLDTHKFGGRIWSGNILRLAMMMTHYRQPIDWTLDRLQETQNRLSRWRNSLGDLGIPEQGKLLPNFIEALSDDLDTTTALSALDDAAAKLRSRGPQDFVQLANDLAATMLWFGIASDKDFDLARQETDDLREDIRAATVGLGKEYIHEAIAARNAARKAKNFAESDRIRDELLAKGIVLKDGPQGTTWEVKR